MASSSSSQDVPQEVAKECPYPYPSNLSATSFISVKLSGRDEYDMWKTQMQCLLKSHGMYGFIDGTLISPKTSSSTSGKAKVGDNQSHSLWARSDAVVKGWILGSLSKQTLGYVLNLVTRKLPDERDVDDFSAKDVWDILQTIYGPAVIRKQQPMYDGPAPLQQQSMSDVPVPLQQQPVYDGHVPLQQQPMYHAPVPLQQQPTYEDLDKQAEAEARKSLYQAVLGERWYSIREALYSKKVTVIDKITDNGNTALHVAVSNTKDPEFIELLLGLVPENTQLMGLRNSDGSTLLHVAAIVGNTEAAEILVKRYPGLMFVKDKKCHTPLALALSNMHTKTSELLLKHTSRSSTTDLENDNDLFSGTSGDDLLVTAISSKNFGLANDLIKLCKALHSDTVLMALAQNFPPDIFKLEIFQEASNYLRGAAIGEVMISVLYESRTRRYCSCVFEMKIMIIYGIIGIIGLLQMIPQILVLSFFKERAKNHAAGEGLLHSVLEIINNSTKPASYHRYYTNPLFEATRQNSYEVVENIVSFFPDAILCTNADGHDIIQYAVVTRSDKVYNLLYQMSEHKNVYRTKRDSCGNNLLHLAARLSPTSKLNLISGAALQIQRELQWFKEVERFVCPLCITQKNAFDETPRMVFTREHKDLVIEGEKWMKATAESYTITAALITTIVFAAAITVPGGNNQDTGLPVFTNHTAFTIFAISDAISLFGAVTSLLMFLSILTARFAEQDFLFKLPIKLIIGLTTLFISTAAMIVAFGATLYLVFAQSKLRILITIVVLTCLPIISFVTLQYPLIKDLMSATWGRSIFGKKRDRPFY